jgi:glycosyltransferase involved in cell wall biosynthesis
MFCFAYPPVGGVGMIRPLKFAKFLPAVGVSPTIVTPQNGVGRITCPPGMGELPGVIVHRTGYEDVITSIKARVPRGRRHETRAPVPEGDNQAASTLPARAMSTLRRLVYEAITTPDEHVGWRRFALEAGRELLRAESFDVIFSTSPPETSHLVARRLKHEFGVPWVADLRDLWSGDHYRQRLPLKRAALRAIERRTLRDADAIVTVSEPWRAELAASYARNGRPVVCIPHGFDADDYPIQPSTRPGRFTICYTGSLDRHYQDPSRVLGAVASLIRSGEMARDSVRLDFFVFGRNLPDFDALAARYDLRGVLVCHPALGYLESLARQQAAHVLLALQWQSEAGKGNPPLKVYDYLGARRPILVVGSGEGVLGRLIEDTGAGVVVASHDAIVSTLGAWYREFAASGDVKWRGNESRLAAHSRRVGAEQLAGVLRSVAARRPRELSSGTTR